MIMLMLPGDFCHTYLCVPGLVFLARYCGQAAMMLRQQGCSCACYGEFMTTIILQHNLAHIYPARG